MYEQSREPLPHEEQPPYAPDFGPPRLESDDLDYRHAPGDRLHFSARQRRVDAAALGQLALYLPSFALSFATVALTGWFLEFGWGVPLWAPVLLWLASGALAFHRPTENLFARRVLRLRYPFPGELLRLEPVWREVTGRAGVDGARYRLWVEDNNELNAYAAAGHIVGVTRHAVEHLPSAQLAAVLAHELGHHAGGHSWAGLLGYWYSLPGRALCRAVRSVLLRAAATRRTACLIALALSAGLAVMMFGSATALLAATLPLLALPYAIAALGRRAELRADRYAASLGFAPMLMAALQSGEGPGGAHSDVPVRAASGPGHTRKGTRAHLLESHPDLATRLHHLRRFLEPSR
ncbi:M48 family metalloprotease [Streptomyces cyaneofuscatus]|uniref:M48 family metalloprotease n=1 Tax=Streptomyces TaxID=1883 RepID=UPI001371772F|nr:M48 family metalloprotease [Streptomyces sp. SID2119]MYW33352.1 M48 family metalloprotease [Streptomyces sp. SID2119]